jgi:hypothetical protein
MKKQLVECKSVAISMQDNEKNMITQWKDNEKHLSPLRVTHEKGRLTLKTLSGRGNKQDKKDLVSAGMCLATGAKSQFFGSMLFNSCLQAGAFIHDNMDQKEKERVLNAILDTLHALKPNDEIEGMLIMRLISLNSQISKFMTLSVIEDQSIEGGDLFINRSAKLIRLYNETLEALMRYRRKGVQNVFVQHQHVNVNNGGQAMVGNFQAGGGGGNKNSGGTP